MKKIIDKIKQFGVFEIIVLLIYIAVVSVIVINHECYEDEAQSWLIARDLNPIEIVQQMKYEGHGLVWFYILYPFAQLGFPMGIQKYISFAFAIGTVILILKKSPFNKFLKVLLTFSSGMIFFYSAFARPYCMIPFLLAAISSIYKDRDEHPYLYAILIGLLAHSHLVMVPTSVILIIDYWGGKLILKRKQYSREYQDKLIRSLFIVLAFLISYGIIALSTLGNCTIVDSWDRTDNIKDLKYFYDSVKETCISTVRYLYGLGVVPKYYNILAGIVAILCIIGTKNNLKQALMFWVHFFFTIYIHAFAWLTLATRIMLFIYTLMFWLWNYKQDGQYKKKPKNNIWIYLALVILIIMSAPGTYTAAYQDINKEWSTGKITAEFIEENIPKGACFICTYQELQQAVIGYLNKDDYRFYMPNSDLYVTYITWDDNWMIPVGDSNIKKAIKDLKKEYDELYILGINYPLIEKDNYELIFESTDKWVNNFYARREVFNIYKVY